MNRQTNLSYKTNLHGGVHFEWLMQTQSRFFNQGVQIKSLQSATDYIINKVKEVTESKRQKDH